MDKHTFKVGDRVIVYTRLKYDCVEGQKGFIRERNCEAGVRVSFDNGKYNRIGEDIWYVHNNNLTHDTDFQVGDWVRYEAVKPHIEGYDTEDGKVGQITHLGQEFATIEGELNRERFISNLVKIQPPSVEFNGCIVHDYPPQKDSDDTIIHVFTSYTNKEEKNMRNVFNITHEKYGVVQGVHQVAPGCYCKNGAYYYQGEGWRETEEWVKIEVNKCDEHRLKYAADHRDGEMIKWRYPQ